MDRYEQLGTVASCVLRADDDIVDTITPGPGESRHGLRIVRSSHVLEVIAEEGRVAVRYPFSISGQVAQHLSAEDAAGVLTETEQSQLGPQEARQYAARKQVAAIDGETQETIVEAGLSAVEPVRSRTQSVTTTVDETQVWDGLTLYDYCYPTDDAFGPTVYDDLMTQVLTEGHGCGKAMLSATPLVDGEGEIES